MFLLLVFFFLVLYALLSILCVPCFCVVLCIVPFLFVQKFLDHCHRVETQLQLINILWYRIVPYRIVSYQVESWIVFHLISFNFCGLLRVLNSLAPNFKYWIDIKKCTDIYIKLLLRFWIFNWLSNPQVEPDCKNDSR